MTTENNAEHQIIENTLFGEPLTNSTRIQFGNELHANRFDMLKPYPVFLLEDNRLTGPVDAKIFNRPFICKFCEEGYALEKELVKHLKTIHSIERPFQCTQCNGSFKFKSNLINHARSHNHEKNFICQKCEKGFKRKINLIAHTKIDHSNKKSYNSAYETLLSQSLKTKKRVKVFACRYCPKKCYNKMTYQNHVKVHLKKNMQKSDFLNTDGSIVSIDSSVVNEPVIQIPASHPGVRYEIITDDQNIGSFIQGEPIVITVIDGNNLDLEILRSNELYASDECKKKSK